ncbi:MAG: ectoine hydroxylase-related dioxygenase (phytanoyl-CoA dioxygenase family) [Verrucomicrobiales bacterium]|jgi:ectoine hydroxylase-related dioxygenase (phytanoyl-CoA dioxygenase family)
MFEVDITALDEQMEHIIDELLTGPGAVVIRNAFDADQVAAARDLIMSYSDETDKETHFQGANADKLHLQRRVWNLLAKGEIFESMVQHPDVVRITSAFLGNKFHLGSIAANRLLPGGPGQEPHIDYPYWDLYEREGFPARINSSYPLNLQVTIPLDPFNDVSGASAFLAGSQGTLLYPEKTDRDRFHAECDRMSGNPGDAVIFNGMVWHCAMPNESDHDRTAVLIEYLPKFVIPLEDQLSGVPQFVIDRGTPLFHQLVGIARPYPKLFDEAAGENTIGRD